MYNVPARFHSLINSGAKTRVRVYLFGAAVDPIDDNDVQTNGTLLKMLPTDTDSNGRISESGIEWTDIFNSDINPHIGDAVSVMVQFGLINTDGAYTGHTFERCKIYLDVYDAANTAWLTCPMGAFVFEQPEQTYGSVVILRAFDQMQDLNSNADTWFNTLDYTTPITVEDILTGLCTQTRKTLSANTLTNLVNKSVSFASAPFQSEERTYRDILAYIAEITASIARFDKDGYLDLRWFDEAQISGDTYEINADMNGCGVFNIVRGEYSVSAITGVEARSLDMDIPVQVGASTSVYKILGNPFISDNDAAAITTKITPIRTALNGLGAFTPISMRTVFDPSIEAGDIIDVTVGGVTYKVPIFQTKLTWRGSIVICELLSSGNKVFPQSASEQDRSDYRTEKTIWGSVSFRNLETPGETVINGSNIYGGTITLGGNANGNGLIHVLNSNGVVTGVVDNSGFETSDPVHGNKSTVKNGYIELYDEDGVQRAVLVATAGGASIDMNTIDGYSIDIDASGQIIVNKTVGGNTVRLLSYLPAANSFIINKTDGTNLFEVNDQTISINTPYAALGGFSLKNLLAPGTAIVSGADLNNFPFNGIGAWSCNSTTVAVTLFNCPTQRAFKLITGQLVTDERYYQIIFENNDVGIYIRYHNKTTNTFTSWQKVNTTTV